MILVTESAKERMLEVLQNHDETVVYLFTTNKGCGGNSYSFGFIDEDEIDPKDEVIPLTETHKLVVGYKHVPMLFGTTIEWETNGLEGEFTFDNPNATGSCGCGSSFTTGQSCSD
jgi:iron-sulfur cluster assembly protein